MVWEYTLYNFNSLKFIEFVLWSRIWSIMVYILWACEKNIYFALVACSIKSQLDPIHWWYYWVLYSWWFSVWLFYSLLKGELKSLIIVVDLPLSKFSQSLHHIFCGSVVWWYTFKIASLLGILMLLPVYNIPLSTWQFALLWSLLYVVLIQPSLISFD